jgi:hypothetical protein
MPRRSKRNSSGGREVGHGGKGQGRGWGGGATVGGGIEESLERKGFRTELILCSTSFHIWEVKCSMRSHRRMVIDIIFLVK